MKTVKFNQKGLVVLFLSVGLWVGVRETMAGDRYRPAYPHGDYEPRDRPDPRGYPDSQSLTDSRAAANSREVAASRAATEARAAVNPRMPAGYVHTLPAGYATRVYGGLPYYYSGGNYYYAYAGEGPTVYVQAQLVDGVPTVPLRPYVYSLPAGYTTQVVAGATYYDYYGYYYYVYYINGRTVYVLAPLNNGVPTVPPPPY
jgi:hypothetical protein